MNKNGLNKNTVIIFTAANGSTVAGTLPPKTGKKPQGLSKKPTVLSAGAGQFTDIGVRVPLIVKAPALIPENNLYTRDLVDVTDFYPTILGIAGLKADKKSGISFLPSIKGSLDPFIKRNWIYCQKGKSKGRHECHL